jgi:hypothetical protein
VHHSSRTTAEATGLVYSSIEHGDPVLRQRRRVGRRLEACQIHRPKRRLKDRANLRKRPHGTKRIEVRELPRRRRAHSRSEVYETAGLYPCSYVRLTAHRADALREEAHRTLDVRRSVQDALPKCKSSSISGCDSWLTYPGVLRVVRFLEDLVGARRRDLRECTESIPEGILRILGGRRALHEPLEASEVLVRAGEEERFRQSIGIDLPRRHAFPARWTRADQIEPSPLKNTLWEI